jgi:hypothetical protein
MASQQTEFPDRQAIVRSWSRQLLFTTAAALLYVIGVKFLFANVVLLIARNIAHFALFERTASAE